MSDHDTSTGIPNPDKPGHWLVPPWEPGASLLEVVLHFVRRHPRSTANTAHVLAYYVGFAAALDGAPAEEPLDALDRRWHEDMRDCVSRCVRLFREKRAAEVSRKCADTAPVMRPAA